MIYLDLYIIVIPLFGSCKTEVTSNNLFVLLSVQIKTSQSPIVGINNCTKQNICNIKNHKNQVIVCYNYLEFSKYLNL